VEAGLFVVLLDYVGGGLLKKNIDSNQSGRQWIEAMAVFDYKARDKSGSLLSGQVDASDRRSAMHKLQAEGLTPVTLKAGSTKPPSPLSRALEKLRALNNSGSGGATAPKENTARKSTAKREKVGLAAMKRLLELHSSGLPAGDSIRILSQRLSEKEQKTLATALWRDLSEGATLAGAMARQPKYFSSSVAYVIEAGEATGNLAPILRKVIEYLEEKHAIRQKMLASMAYPGFICTVAVGVMILFVTILLPMIKNMTDRLGGEVPFLAKFIIGGSEFAAQSAPFLTIGLVAAVVIWVQARRTPKGRLTTDGWMLHLPLFGKIFYYSELFQVGSLVSTLLKSGINTTETLKLTERTINNVNLRERFRLARAQVNEGLSIAQALKRNNFMPDIALDVLAVGENSGNLGASMEEITKSFRNSLNQRISLMITLITSGALGCAFLFVGLVAVAMVLSVLGISQSI
jgi:type II secretory pathway component PulF